MSETSIGKEIQLIASKLGHRLFRMNTGLAWIGQAIKLKAGGHYVAREGDVLIRNARPFKSGFKGMLDYGGWTKDGKTLWVEIKTKDGIVSPEQRLFIDAIKNVGGVAFVARTSTDALEELS